MGAARNIAKAGLGVVTGVSALGIAYGLGGGELHAAATNGPLLVAAGVVGGAMLHVPAHAIWSFVETMAGGIERQIEAIGRNQGPAGNEDAERVGRIAAIHGALYSVKHYGKAAKVDPAEHDLRQFKTFRRAARKWGKREVAAASRKDRPHDGAWMREGLSLEAVGYPIIGRLPDARDIELEKLAWAELTSAMSAAKVEIPAGFQAHFVGKAHCGPGWRKAGHLYFMKSLKQNHDAEVGFNYDRDLRTQALLREILRRLPPAGGPDVVPDAGLWPLSARKAKARPAEGPKLWKGRPRG